MALAATPASIAGLPVKRAIVWVGPPLSANVASIGLAPVWSPVPVNPDASVALPRRLWPLLVTAPSTLGPGVGALLLSPLPLAAVLPALIVFSRATLAGPTRMPPPVPSATRRGGLLAPP